MPDENRVFDITKPSHVNPTATSKPVIVGHRPELNDPMVKEHGLPTLAKIQVNDGPAIENNPSVPAAGLVEPLIDSKPANQPANFDGPAIIHDHYASEPAPKETLPPASPDTMAARPTEPQPVAATLAQKPEPHIEQLHFATPPRRRKWPWVVLVILLLLVGAYLAIDSDLIHTNINLPVHIFKQKVTNSPAASTTSSSNAATNTPAVPAGFSKYRLTGTNITFAAPTDWGDPTSTAVPGYSQRGGTNQSDGTYAYLVDFATNKDIELAVTSDKYLPASGPTLYYDYLQWCTGTVDGKYYESTLDFTTTNNIDTPTTATCDQGPVPDATKLDSATIVQTKAQDTSGKTIGDIYTKNLTDADLVVFRVKDAAMTNGDTIKQLLGTVQTSSTGTSQ